MLTNLSAITNGRQVTNTVGRDYYWRLLLEGRLLLLKEGITIGDYYWKAGYYYYRKGLLLEGITTGRQATITVGRDYYWKAGYYYYRKGLPLEEITTGRQVTITIGRDYHWKRLLLEDRLLLL